MRFVPYALVGVIHLVTLFLGGSGAITKPVLMIALLIGFLLSKPRGEKLLFGALAIGFSFAGDVQLETPGDIGFLLGLGGFFLAHLAYLVLFLRPIKTRRMPLAALAYLVWWAALMLYLAPHIGPLLVPVAAYGLVLAASAAAALGTNRTTAVGALVFLLSDTLLAFKLFYPDFTFWQIDFVIMLLYIAGQGLIVWGAVSPARTPPTTQPL